MPEVNQLHEHVADKATGYWGFLTGSIFLLFVLYLAGKGALKDWIAVLVPNPVSAPKVGQDPNAANSALGGQADASKPVNVGALNAITGGLMGSPGTPVVPPGHTVLGDTLKKFGIPNPFGGP
jgi:hypothetical protein